MKTITGKTLMFVLLLLAALQACASPVQMEPVINAEGIAQPLQMPEIQPVDNAPQVVPVYDIPLTLPELVTAHAADQVSAPDTPISGGDRFTYGQFERPFNAQTMDEYYPALDIVDTLVKQDQTWIFGVMQLSGLDQNGHGKYALEFDVDRDGRGDYLVVVLKPVSTDWAMVGVQIFSDENNDVGDASPLFTDEGAFDDGFEALIFDGELGDDSESAFVRISPDSPNVIEFAVKQSVLGSPSSFMVNMWAGTSLLDPALFDLNDAFTHEQAGAANPGFELFYPIKAVSEIDNSCRLAVGFQPSGNEPGLCKTLVHVNPSDPTSPYMPYTAPDYSCEPCNVGASGQEPYPDCTCTYPPIP